MVQAKLQTNANMQLEESGTDEKVSHNYHDYANAPLRDIDQDVASGPGGDPPFPLKLHHALKDLQADDMEEIVSWQPHGRCFVVHRQKEFQEKVLPLYFRQSKFSSFQRQLNLYGFKRLSQGPDKNGYYHPMFLRTKPDLAAYITRTVVKNKGPRRAASPSTEPNLYSYPPLPFDAQEDDKQSKVQEQRQAQDPSSPSIAPSKPQVTTAQIPSVSEPQASPVRSLAAASTSLQMLSTLVAYQIVQNNVRQSPVSSLTPLYSPIAPQGFGSVPRGVLANGIDLRRALMAAPPLPSFHFNK